MRRSYAPLSEASLALARWRSASNRSEGTPTSAVEALFRARAAARSRDALGTIQAVEALGAAAGIESGANWLAAALSLVLPSGEPPQPALLGKLASSQEGQVARRALAAHAIQREKPDLALSALAEGGDETWSPNPASRSPRSPMRISAALSAWADPLLEHPDFGVLASAARAANRAGRGRRRRSEPGTRGSSRGQGANPLGPSARRQSDAPKSSPR